MTAEEAAAQQYPLRDYAFDYERSEVYKKRSIFIEGFESALKLI